MQEQISWNDGFTVFDGDDKEETDKLKCFKTELAGIDYLSIEELFSGFDTIKAITFSYDLKFINKIMNMFKYGEIILGAPHIVDKDEELVSIIANPDIALEIIKKYPGLVEKMKDEDLYFKVPEGTIDHRKIYLLKADDGRTRVIFASANMGTKAWEGESIEGYSYSEQQYYYEELDKDFDTAWEFSVNIEKEALTAKNDNLADKNILLKDIEKTKKVLLLEQKEENETVLFNTEYVLFDKKCKNAYRTILEGTDSKNGKILVDPSAVERMRTKERRRKAEQKVKIINTKEEYPTLEFNYDTNECIFNGDVLNLQTSEEDIKNNIEDIFKIFKNFDQFVGNKEQIEELKETHFKILNAMFSSPFHAKLQYITEVTKGDKVALPLYMMVTSKGSNNGKTFMIETILKLMSGKELVGENANGFGVKDMALVQANYKGIPFFVDEVGAKFAKEKSSLLKNDKLYLNDNFESTPMLVFATNEVNSLEIPYRKRMLFFELKSALPSDIDKAAFGSQGKAIIKKITNAFYKEYLKRMLPIVNDEIEFHYSKNKPEDYYTDILAKSSEVIISILKDYGYEIPGYIKPLTWYDDYRYDRKDKDIIRKIEEFMKENKKSFSVENEKIIFYLGDNKKEANKWQNNLPAELQPEVFSSQKGFQVKIDKQKWEEISGTKTKRPFKSFFRR